MPRRMAAIPIPSQIAAPFGQDPGRKPPPFTLPGGANPAFTDRDYAMLRVIRRAAD